LFSESGLYKRQKKDVLGINSREGTLPSAAQRGASRHRPPTLGLLLFSGYLIIAHNDGCGWVIINSIIANSVGELNFTEIKLNRET